MAKKSKKVLKTTQPYEKIADDLDMVYVFLIGMKFTQNHRCLEETATLSEAIRKLRHAIETIGNITKSEEVG